MHEKPSPEKEPDLPPICPDGQHSWAINPSMHGCGAGGGDHAVGELLVILTPVKTGQPGAVCQKCFTVYGTNQRHEGLCWALRAMSEW